MLQILLSVLRLTLLKSRGEGILRVIHFVTGGFSGATKVAIDLIGAHNKLNEIDSLLVLRQKKTTSDEKLLELKNKDIEYRLVTGKTHLTTILELRKLCEVWQPDILVAHGFPEHILGRYAGILANVPHMVQVEHNSRERYTLWKLYQSRKLSAHTDLIIGVSKGVASILSQQGLKAPIKAIPNGINTQRFGNIDLILAHERPKDLIMVGRYAKSKDHVTLVKALNILKNEGLTPSLTLVGSGRKRYKREVLSLIKNYKLEDQVTFIDYSSEVDKLLQQHKVFIMSSRFEGLNLAVLEAMASGCIVVGSKAMGVEELIEDGFDGFLFEIGQADELALHIKEILAKPAEHHHLTVAARDKVLKLYDSNRVAKDYYSTFKKIISN